MAGMGSIKLPSFSPTLRRKLTQDETDFLVQLCVSNKDDCPFSEHKKGFWMQMSDRFEISCGRCYSWQSCRRQLIAWENKQTTQLEIRATNEMVQTPPDPEEVFEEQIDEEDSVDNAVSESDIDDSRSLPEPAAPLIRRGRALRDIEKSMMRKDIVNIVSSTLDSFESQLQTITATIEDTEDGQSAIQNAFNVLKAEVQISVEKYTSRNALK